MYWNQLQSWKTFHHLIENTEQPSHINARMVSKTTMRVIDDEDEDDGDSSGEEDNG